MAKRRNSSSGTGRCKVTITHNRAQIQRKVTAGAQKAITVLTEQVVKDSNYYCRQDQGTLISSSMHASNYPKGKAVWDTPYARRVFYTGHPSKDVNPHAQLMWVEKARAAFGSNWTKIAEKALRQGLK